MRNLEAFAGQAIQKITSDCFATVSQKISGDSVDTETTDKP